MSDNTWGTIITYDGEPEDIDGTPFTDWMEEHIGAGLGDRSDGTLHFSGEVRLGSIVLFGADSDAVADRLIALGVSFVAWEDPKYEWLGSLVAFTPSLGRFDAACDSDGNVVLRAEEVRELFHLTDEERDRRLGGPWDRHLDATSAAGRA